MTTPGFVLQAATAPAGDGVRFGFTASRRVGAAVMRNRARRRLKALVREVLLPAARAGWDYVLVARAATASRPWPALVGDMEDAVRRLGACRGRTDAR